MQDSYSSTPLLKKLGIKENSTVRIINPPSNYFQLLNISPIKLNIRNDIQTKKDFIHFFATSMSQLDSELLLLKSEILDTGLIWISWNKKASRISTDITEDKIREIALINGLVDVKVCSIDEKWSALKLVIPLSKRKPK